MMILPESSPDAAENAAPNSWVRGTCPRCGGDQVIHRVIGMPTAEAHATAPSWVDWAGCTSLGPDRSCEECTHTWWASDVGAAEEPDDEDWDEDEMSGEAAPLRVVGAVLVRDQQILTARRAPGKSSAGLWEFPGGKIEVGESPQQALVRELHEELGIEVEVGWLIGRGEADLGDRDLHLDCYWARPVAAPPTSSTDHDRLEWVDRGALCEREWAGPDIPIVERIVAGAAPRFRRP